MGSTPGQVSSLHMDNNTSLNPTVTVLNPSVSSAISHYTNNACDSCGVGQLFNSGRGTSLKLLFSHHLCRAFQVKKQQEQ